MVLILIFHLLKIFSSCVIQIAPELLALLVTPLAKPESTLQECKLLALALGEVL